MNVSNAELGNQLNEHLLKCPQSQHAIDSAVKERIVFSTMQILW